MDKLIDTALNRITPALRRMLERECLLVLHAGFRAGYEAAKDGKRLSISQMHKMIAANDSAMWRDAYSHVLVAFTSGVNEGMGALVDAVGEKN